MTDLITVKMEAESLRLLRIVAAMTGEKQYIVLSRLLIAEYDKLNQNNLLL